MELQNNTKSKLSTDILFAYISPPPNMYLGKYSKIPIRALPWEFLDVIMKLLKGEDHHVKPHSPLLVQLLLYTRVTTHGGSFDSLSNKNRRPNSFTYVDMPIVNR